MGLIKPFIAFIPVKKFVLAPLLPRTPVTPLLAIFVAAERRTDFGIRSKFFVPNLSINLSLPNLLKYLFITEGDTLLPNLSNPFSNLAQTSATKRSTHLGSDVIHNATDSNQCGECCFNCFLKLFECLDCTFTTNVLYKFKGLIS